MTLSTADLLKDANFKPVTGQEGANITGCYICDLLSWAMSGVQEGDAWVTVQGHINVAAVAQLTNAACVIVCDGAAIEAQTIEKCEAGGIPLISTGLDAYAVAKVIAAYEK